MASDKVLPVTAEQPTRGGLGGFTMSYAEIKTEISATHVPAEKDFDANSLFVVVKQILKRFDVVPIQDRLHRQQDRKDPEILQEEASTESLDPILSIDDQLSLEMAHKALDAETAHITTMSILNKLSSYSWQTKAVLALANFALDYKKYILATAQHDPWTQLFESVEIPGYVIFQRKEAIKKDISEMLTATEYIFELEKQKSKSTNNVNDVSMLSRAMDDVPVLVYWIIMTAIAFLTLTLCLTGSGDNTQEMLSLAKSIYRKLFEKSHDIGYCLNDIRERKATRRVKEFLQAPDQVTEVLKALIFGKDDVQPLIDSCLDKPVNLDVLKDEGVLLFISDLHVSRDDILIMKPIYEEITDYNIVWIPIVAQWTNELRKKFDMLRSQMPWYVLQYFSQLAGIKFIKEEWHFENDPVVVAMDARGKIQGENLLPKIRTEGTRAVPIKFEELAFIMRPTGPHSIEDYNLYCGGKDSRWIEQFSEKVNAMAEDPIIKEALISMHCSCVKKVKTWNPFKKAPKTQKRNEEIQRILPSFKNEKRWAVMIKWSKKIVSHDGSTILKVLEMFDEWKQHVSERGFENCFKEYHDKLCSTNPNPSASPPENGRGKLKKIGQVIFKSCGPFILCSPAQNA